MFALALGMLLSGPKAAKAQTSVQPPPTKVPSIPILSPKDCFILDVIKADGAAVEAGEIILRLDSEDEDQTISNIDIADAFVGMQEESMSDSQIELRRDILRSTIEISDAYYDYANTRYTDMLSSYDKGAPYSNDVSFGATLQQAAAALIRAQAEKKRSRSALELFEFNINQAKQKVNIIKGVRPREKDRLRRRRDRLAIRSPTSGTLKLLTYPGAFVNKGFIVAEIV